MTETQPTPTPCPRCGSVTRPRNGLQAAYCARCGAALPKPAASTRTRRRAGRVSAVVGLGLAGAVLATQEPWVGLAAGGVLLLSALQSWRLDWVGTPVRVLALGLLLFGFVSQSHTRHHRVPVAQQSPYHQQWYQADEADDHWPDCANEHREYDEYNEHGERRDYSGYKTHRRR
jgi:hypothetical protein